MKKKKRVDTLTPKILELFQGVLNSNKVKQYYTVYEMCTLFKENAKDIRNSICKVIRKFKKDKIRLYSIDRLHGYTVAKSKKQKKMMFDKNLKKMIGNLLGCLIPLGEEADLDINLLPVLNIITTYENKYIKTPTKSISGKKNIQGGDNTRIGK